MPNFHSAAMPQAGNNYQKVLLHYEQIKPWRGSSPKDPRPLSGNRNRQMTIRKLDDGALACRLYNTDVVTFHPNGAIELQTYSSRTTDDFANALMGSNGIQTLFNSSIGQLVVVPSWEHDPSKSDPRGDVYTGARRIYNIGSGSFLSPDPRGGWRVEDSEPITRWVRDKAQAKEAMELHTNFHDYTIWYRAICAMGQLPERIVEMNYNNTAPKAFAKCELSDERLVELLDTGPDQWLTLASYAAPGKVRDAILTTEGVGGEPVEVPYLTDWRQIARIRSSQIKLGGAYRMRPGWR